MIIASGLFPEYPCSTEVDDDHHHHHHHQQQEQQRRSSMSRIFVPPPPPPPPPPYPRRFSTSGIECAPPQPHNAASAAQASSPTHRRMSCSDINATHCMNSCAAYGKICPYVARMACQYATHSVESLKRDSVLFSNLEEDGEVDADGDTGNNGNDDTSSVECCFTRIPASDIRILEKIGEGGFSNVNRCMVKTKKKKTGTTVVVAATTKTAAAATDSSAAAAAADTVEPETTEATETTIEEQEFAVKYLRRKAMVDLHQFKHGAADLACEAYFLQVLHHPNIVQLHGISSSCSSNKNMVDSFAAAAAHVNSSTNNHHHSHRDTAEHSFFIVIDKLNDTLENKIHEWKCEREKHQQLQYSNLMILSRLTNPLFSQHDNNNKERKRTQLLERLQIALDIAHAMEYLHSLNVIFRDLKPDNIGFTANGQLKLFDFGLAKELKASLKSSGTDSSNEAYTLTGNTGSRRYMAPEVAQEQPYGKSVDVYSFGILVWELLCAEKPFYGYSSGQHMQLVVLGGERPKMDTHHTCAWPSELITLVTQCWSPCPKSRPTFTEIIKVLNGILFPVVVSTTTTTPGMLETTSTTQVIIPQRPSNDETRSSNSSSAATPPPLTPLNNKTTTTTTTTTSSLSSPLTALFRVTTSPLKPLVRSQRSRSAGDHHGGKTTTTTTTLSPPRSPLPPPPPLTLPVVGEEGFVAISPLPATSNRRTKSWGFGLRR